MSVRGVTLLTVVLAWVSGCKGPAPESRASDQRQALALPAEAQEAVRVEMNGMLTSLNRILLALPQDDTGAIRAAAAASGLGTAADPALEKLLPEQFMTWGTHTHQGFDTLAASVTRGYDRDSVVGQLGRITQLCVTCHATYRLSSR